MLVRRVRWGPAVAPCNCSGGNDSLFKLRYWFPNDHSVESVTDVFEERDALVQLLSIAVRSKLVSHTVFNALPPWMAQLDPNFRTESPGGRRGVFDVWPEDCTPSAHDIDAYIDALRGWLSFYAGKRAHNMDLARISHQGGRELKFLASTESSSARTA